ncbi:hypothetical protein LTR95_005823 [Oleoguttula sp. CCFEE 5521]
MADYGGPQYTGRNRTARDGGPKGVQRNIATSLKEHEPLFDTYEHLSGLERGDAALTMLRKIASTVKPIMSKRGWRVQILAEFLPAEQNLLGLNVNKGYKICIRLRYHNNPDLFLPLEQVVDTMLHELSHIVWGEHDSNFHRLWDELRDEHETLVRKGYTGEGFLGAGRKVGGTGYRAPPLHEMRRLAQVSAEKRKKQISLSAGSARRLGGAPLTQGVDAREVIAEQTLMRSTINRGCASGRKDAGQLSLQSEKGSFKTKAEEDDANDRAIAQAIYDLMEEEEEGKLKGTFNSAPTNGGLAWSEDRGLYEPVKPQISAANNSQPSMPTEDEQLRWAMEESTRANRDAPDSDPQGLPPECLISPISPRSSRRIDPQPLGPDDEPPMSLFSPVSPLTQPPSALTSNPPAITPPRAQPLEPQRNSSITNLDISEPFNPDQWTCEICTCINPVQFLACDACGVERSSAPPKLKRKTTVTGGSANGMSATVLPPVTRPVQGIGWKSATIGDECNSMTINVETSASQRCSRVSYQKQSPRSQLGRQFERIGNLGR